MDKVFTRMTPEEACEFLGCQYSWLLRQTRNKKIPHYRIGHRVMFTRERLEKWVEQQMQENYVTKRG